MSAITINGHSTEIPCIDPDKYYTKTEVDNITSNKADASTVYTKAQTDGLLNDKANAADVYTKTEDDALLDAKANASDVYTKAETDSEIGKAFKLVYKQSSTFTVAANAHSTQTLDLDIPEGYTFGAYRQVSIGGSGATSCVLRFFSSAGNGTKAQVAIRNITDAAVQVTVSVTVLCVKMS